MDGPQNSQGWDSFGPIPDKQQAVSTVWHERWQGHLTAIYAVLFTTIAGNGIQGKPSPFYGLDAARWGRELLSPRDYMNASYYGLWLHTIALFVDTFGQFLGITSEELVRRKITSPQRLARARAIRKQAGIQTIPGCDGPPKNGLHQSRAYDPTVAGSIGRIGDRAKFSVGDRIRIIRFSGTWHSRTYPYIRGAEGTIMQYYGLSEESIDKFDGKYHGPYPEVACQSRQKFYAPVYSVRFRASDCFGNVNTDPRMFINIDIWEPMMELV
ncbi:MAG: nitrile hydratase subunit beta [Cyanobacteria bacterium K_Offshore_surface_m2_239]|nr:nitrile hydratase subunit beta [Cyanobacteria bacterium K_Offshore_surface_m2_239]